MRELTKKRIVAVCLYALPILFFAISYFLITTSGEDIHQGAGRLGFGSELNFFDDAAAAFRHSGRITDVYAWTVADLFDYQFQFGVDTIFRLFDLLMMSGVLFLTTRPILGRKLSLTTRDALVFVGVFLAVVLSPFGRRLYSEFSMIHNYVPLVLITLLFAVPYLRLALKKTTPKRWWFGAVMLAGGVLFGLSTTVTPLAFVLAVVVYDVILAIRKKWQRPPAWFWLGLVGTMVGFLISFLGSDGMGSYATGSASAFDYVPLAESFREIPKLAWHLVYNFGLVLVPLIGVFGVGLVFMKNRRQAFRAISEEQKKVFLIMGIFVVIHVIGTIQIKAQPRILTPAYFAGLIAIFSFIVPHLKSRFLGWLVIAAAVGVVIIHAVFLGIYHDRMAGVLEEIKNSDETAVCVDWDKNVAPRIPVINLSQEFMVVDWGYPEVIYGKSVVFCR